MNPYCVICAWDAAPHGRDAIGRCKECASKGILPMHLEPFRNDPKIVAILASATK